ncbi:transposable element Tcb1 transposase [Trichonephila clavipes]|nr:transposable element Tcb1 transposase [Trichonephila clavipes]
MGFDFSLFAAVGNIWWIGFHLCHQDGNRMQVGAQKNTSALVEIIASFRQKSFFCVKTQLNNRKLPVLRQNNRSSLWAFSPFKLTKVDIKNWEIGSRVGRNQTTVIRICDRWMQEGTMDQRGRLHPTQCTISREDRQIVRMAVTDRSVTIRTVAQHIDSATHHSVSAHTIRHRLQQSGLTARRPLLGLPLKQNHRLRREWCDERRMWAAEWNEVVFTDESRICLQHHDGRIQVWRHNGQRMLKSCVMCRHTGPAPGIMVWGGIGYYSRTPLLRISDTLNSQRYVYEVLEPVVLPYLQGLATAIFQQDNARPDVACIVQRFFVNHQI